MAAGRAYQDVGRIDGMPDAGGGPAMAVKEFHRDFSGFLRHGDEEDVLEGLADAGGFLAVLPFLEEGGERIGIQYFAVFGIADDDLSVPGQVETVHVDVASVPSVEGFHLGERNLGGFVGAGEDVVEPQGLFLCGGEDGRQCDASGQEEAFEHGQSSER